MFLRRFFLVVFTLILGCRTFDGQQQKVSTAKGGPASSADGSDLPLTAFKNLAFDVNDLSILFPITNTLPYPEMRLDQVSLVALGVRDLWPKASAFDRLMDFAAGKDFSNDQIPEESEVMHLLSIPARHRQSKTINPLEGLSLGEAAQTFHPAHKRIGIFRRDGVEKEDLGSVVPFAPDGIHEFVRDEKRWRIVSLRIDPCAHAHGAYCEVEMRLIAQAFDDGDFPLDASAHLLFHLGVLGIENAEFLAGSSPQQMSRSFRELIQDMQRIKALSLTVGASTDGVPLAPHPGLSKEASVQPEGSLGPLGRAVAKLINTYSVGGLSTVTAVLTVDASPWVFFQGQVIDGTWHPVPITGGNDQFSIRKMPVIGSSNGKVLPEPLTRPATAELFNLQQEDPKRDYRIENPGRYGEPEPKLSVGNLDCVSCHTTGLSRHHEAETDAARHLDVLYIPEEGITGYRGQELSHSPATIWNFRAFGYLSTSPSAVSRTVNEAAEAVRLVNSRILPAIYAKEFKNPGFVCRSINGRTHSELHAALIDCQRLGHTFDDCRMSVCTAP